MDELEQIQDLNAGRSNPNVAEEEEKGEGLSGDDMMELSSFISLSLSILIFSFAYLPTDSGFVCKDYIGTAKLDQYNVADINDDPDVPNLDPKTRALAEAQMA